MQQKIDGDFGIQIYMKSSRAETVIFYCFTADTHLHWVEVIHSEKSYTVEKSQTQQRKFKHSKKKIKTQWGKVKTQCRKVKFSRLETFRLTIVLLLQRMHIYICSLQCILFYHFLNPFKYHHCDICFMHKFNILVNSV